MQLEKNEAEETFANVWILRNYIHLVKVHIQL